MNDSNMTQKFAMHAQGVHKAYASRPDAAALDKVNLEVQLGECFALVGINGAGKTTLIKSFLDLTPVQTGKLSVFGIPCSSRAARARLTYLPERFAPHSWLKTRDYIKLVLDLHRVTYQADTSVRVLQSMGLEAKVLDLSFRECSKGMGQKIGLAAAILSQRELLILDEPMSGLDPISRVQVKNLLREQRAQGRTIFMCTHALGDVGELADRVCVIHAGQIRFTGAVPEWLAAHNTTDLEQAYLSTVNAAISKTI